MRPTFIQRTLQILSKSFMTFMSVSYASKAFDRVDYTVLFQTQMARKRSVSAYILCLLWNWYGHHFAKILLAGVISDGFTICNQCNGVRQGGILSPLLFGIYIDELSLQLN